MRIFLLMSSSVLCDEVTNQELKRQTFAHLSKLKRQMFAHAFISAVLSMMQN